MKLFGILALWSLVVSGHAYGADDCEPIRQQLAGASPGQIVTVPPGDYWCSAPLVMDRDGVTLRGTVGKTQLHLIPHSNSPLIVMGVIAEPPTPVRHLRLEGFELDGNMANQDMECWNGPCDSTGTAFIRNNGVSIRNVLDSEIVQIIAHHNRSGGLVTEKGTRRLSVTVLEAYANFFDGLAGYETEECSFTNLDLHHNHSAGISIDLRFNHNSFDQVHIWANGDVGIYARFSSANRFENMTIESSGSHGIFLSADQTLDRCAADYVFHRVAILNNVGYGLVFADAICAGTRFTETRFAANRAGCFWLAPNSQVDMPGALCDGK